jgi:flagellar biosynthesis protein FlhG
MLDQADDLRRLATESGGPSTVRAAGRPTLLAITGGKGGVGTTTIAINVATSLTRAGCRALLVDADPRGGDVALRCGAEERHTLADLLAGRHTWTDVIETVPGGIQLVAGARWSDDLADRSPAAAERLIELLDDSDLGADAVIVDVGNDLGRAGQRICQMADAIVMVTTSETAAVIGAFAAIKRLVHLARDYGGMSAIESAFPLQLVVNVTRTVQNAKIVHHRLGRACRRLLGVEIVEKDILAGCLASVGRTSQVAGNAPTGPLCRRPFDAFRHFQEKD